MQNNAPIGTATVRVAKSNPFAAKPRKGLLTTTEIAHDPNGVPMAFRLHLVDEKGLVYIDLARHQVEELVNRMNTMLDKA